jgi:hypothetical protein
MSVCGERPARSWALARRSLDRAGGRDALPVAVSNFLKPLSQAIGVKLHGIVGYNFLREFRVTFDYPGSLLAFDRL